jgi:hypothetical protein
LSEIVIIQEAGVKAHESESPPSFGLKAGAFADVGTLILTSRRLIYVMKGGASRAAAWALGGALAASAIEKNVSQAEIDEVARYPGSYVIPIENITAVRADRKMGGAYLSVSNKTPGLKPAYSFVFGSGFSRNDQWVNAINCAKANRNAAPVNAQPQQQPLPPPPDFAPPSCPMCGGSLSYIQQYQRWYCYRDQKYV